MWAPSPKRADIDDGEFAGARERQRVEHATAGAVVTLDAAPPEHIPIEWIRSDYASPHAGRRPRGGSLRGA